VGRRADVLRKGRDRYLTLAEHDDLTQLLNARAFRERYDRAIEHARKFGEPISLLLADVDSLKEINDRGGHSAGNEALRQVARVLEQSKRAGDLACRWGGDEFAILMPGADSTAAVRLAQTILDHLRAEQALAAGSKRNVSITIGVAAATGSSPSQNLFELADGALYEGKRRGRGQFQIALARDSMGRE
jgi:diguanylate cyclase (GGDEF)-like protein